MHSQVRSAFRILIVGLLASLHCACFQPAAEGPVAQTSADPTAGVEVTFLANEGVLLRSELGKVLLDGFIGEPYSIYGALPAAAAKQLALALPPFDNLDIVLASHVHRDHFQAELACEFFEASPTTCLVTSPQVIAALREECEHECLIEIFPEEPGKRGRATMGFPDVEFLGLSHGTGRFASIQNLGHLIEMGGMKILHVGDAAMNEANFAPYALAREGIDIALVPYWYFQDSAGPKIVNEHFHADHLVALHIPPGELAKVREDMAKNFPEVHIFGASMESRRYEPASLGTEATNK